MKIPSKLLKVKKSITKCAKSYDSEFSILKQKDANNNEFYYLHFKPRGSKSAFSDTLLYLDKQKIRYAGTSGTTRTRSPGARRRSRRSPAHPSP